MRLLSAVLLGAAVWLVVARLLPPPPETGVPVVVVAHDVPAGASMSADDVRVERRPQSWLPPAALRDAAAVVGEVTAGPILAGEFLTPARFRGPSQLIGMPAGSLAVSVPVTDAAVLGSVRPGDLVSVLVAGSGETVAQRAVVLAAEQPGSGLLSSSSGAGHVVVALTPAEARSVAAATNPAAGAAAFLLAVRQ
jgi:Flp pilus assembly protein CpaB